jgi:AcrR family transcriptional regulator
MMASTVTGETDGRSLRRVKNRDAVLDAAIEVFSEGDIEPAIDTVARRAGVSNRSIYRYFADRDTLVHAAIARALEQVLPSLELDGVGDGSLEERIDRFVEYRIRTHEEFGALIRAAKRAAQTQPAIGREFDAAALKFHLVFLENFAREFETLPAGEQMRAALGAQIAFRVDPVDFLYEATNGDDDEVRSILRAHLERVLGPLAERADSAA